jgi:hypothetical protein
VAKSITQLMKPFIADALTIKKTKTMGRGVFTRFDLPAKSVVEMAPVIVMSKKERAILDKTLLHDYIFEWGKSSSQCCMALGWIPLYNHSYTANCDYEMHFTKKLIYIITVREIKAGEELFINYNGKWNNKKPVWFDKEE